MTRSPLDTPGHKEEIGLIPSKKRDKSNFRDRQRLSLKELARRCHKPDHRRIGNWMARRISRPLALCVTWVIAPWGVSANAVSLASWGLALAAAGVFAVGTSTAWLVAAILLQLWYLGDHVDGQLARLRGTASLDGAQLDHLMHHTVNLLVPLGVGWGLFARFGHGLWMLLGVVWGTSLLALSLHHDARYKAFIVRLKRLRGQMLVEGGGGAQPLPQPPIPRQPRLLLGWTLRKACETHVVMNLLLATAIVEWWCDAGRMRVAAAYLAGSAVAALVVAATVIWRSQRDGAVEREFAQWFHVPPGQTMRCENGWWIVEAAPTPAAPAAQTDARADSAAP